MPQLSTNIISRRVNFGVESLGKSLGPIGSILLRLGLVALFFWYLCEFASELARTHYWSAWALRAAAAILLVIFVAIVAIAGRSFDPVVKPKPAGMMPFVLLNLVPIAVLLISVWAGAKFEQPLINFTIKVFNWARSF